MTLFPSRTSGWRAAGLWLPVQAHHDSGACEAGKTLSRNRCTREILCPCLLPALGRYPKTIRNFRKTECIMPGFLCPIPNFDSLDNSFNKLDKEHLTSE